MDRNQKISDERIEIVISRLLLTGLLFASVLVLIGGILYLLQYGAVGAGYRSFHGEPAHLKSLTGIIKMAANLESRGIIQLGLILLIFTPIARVVFSAAAFLIRRDYLYTGLTLFVLVILIYNLFKT